MAREWDEDQRIAYISGIYEERKQAETLVNNTICSIKKAFAVSKRDKTLRDISQETGISISALSGLFQYPFYEQTETNQTRQTAEKENDQVRVASEKQAEISGVPTDGPWMINIARIAKTLDIAIPCLFEFNPETVEYMPSYEEHPNSWDVFVQNLRTFSDTVKKMTRDVYKKVGGVPEEYRIKKREEKAAGNLRKENPKLEGKTEEQDKKKRKSDEIPKGLDPQVDKIRNLAKDFARYYERIVSGNTKETQGGKKYKESNIYPEELLGNPKCELKTIILVTKRLKPTWSLENWFRRWSVQEVEDFEPEVQEKISLYRDEEEKIALIAPYVVKDSQDLIAVIRVGSREVMKEEYSDFDVRTAFGMEELSLLDRYGIESEMRIGVFQDCSGFWKKDTWTEPFEQGVIREGDLLLAFVIENPYSEALKLVTYNLTRMSAETIQNELMKSAVRKEVYKNINVIPMNSSRLYTAVPDVESRDQFYGNDPLWIYHTEEFTENARLFNSEPSIFALHPDFFSRESDYHLDGYMVRFNEEEFFIDVDEEAWLKEMIRGDSREETWFTRRTARFNQSLDWSQWNVWEESGKLALVPNSVLNYDEIELRCVEIQEFDHIMGGFTEVSADTVLARWSIESLTNGVIRKAEKILRERGYDSDFLEAYEKRIRERGIGELLKKNRLWLEVSFHGGSKIRWDWNLKWHIPKEI